MRRCKSENVDFRNRMKGKTVFGSVLAVLLLYAGCAGDKIVLGEETSPPGAKAPVITAYFAPERGKQGDVIRIYLAAENPGGDMRKIGTQVSQQGYGDYPSSWIYLKEGYKERFVGYLQWNTAGGQRLPEGTKISIDISVFDRRGNQSNQIVLPYEFGSGLSSPSALPAPFDQAAVPRLGYISVLLHNPHRAESHK